ncbi:MAG: glycosyltransferase [Cyanophyceae cyanobacterium]
MESTIIVVAGVPADYGDRLGSVLCKAGGQPVGAALDQWIDDALVSQGLATPGVLARNPEAVGESLARRAKDLGAHWQARGGIIVAYAPRITLFLRQWMQWLPTARFLLTYRAPWVSLDNLYGHHSHRGGDGAADPFSHDPERAVGVVEHHYRELLSFRRDFRDQTAAVNLDSFEQQPGRVIDALLGDRRFIPVPSPTELVLPGNDDRVWRSRVHLLSKNHSKTLALYGELNALALAEAAIAPLPNPFTEADPAPSDQPLRDWAHSARSRGLAARSQEAFAQQTDEVRILRKQVRTLELAVDQAQFQKHQAQSSTGQFQARIYDLEPAIAQLQEQLEQLHARYEQQRTLLGTHHTQVQYLTEALEDNRERDRLKDALEDALVNQKQVEAALEREHQRYERAKNTLATSQARFNEAQVRLHQAQDALTAMRTSKFWKLRNRWFKFKGKVGGDSFQDLDRRLFPQLLKALELAPVPPLPPDIEIDVEAEKSTIRATLDLHFPQVSHPQTRIALALFDRDYYLETYPDLAEAIAQLRFVDLFSHFIRSGAAEGRNPSLLFNAQYYGEQNPSVAKQVAAGKYTSFFDHFIQVGMGKGLNPCAAFDNDFYINEYPDVAGLVDVGQVSSAFEHYVLYGGQEGRLPLPLPEMEERQMEELGDRRTMVAFISGCAGAPYRYRCEHQAAILESLGYTVALFEVGQYPHDELLERFRVIVMHRVPYHRALDGLISDAQERGIRVIFETDDWVFEPEMLHQIEDARESDGETQLFYTEMVKQFQRAIAQCDGVTVSTPLLRDAVLAQNPEARVAVLPNRISPAMERVAIAALEQERPAADQDIVRISYFSGTRTHQQDFEQCVGAIATVLDQFPQVRLRIVGHLEVPETLAETLGNRLETLPIVPWQKLPALYRDTDINLAPLNPHVPFTAGKSELKFVEAGLMGVPTVASQWGPYAQTITSGHNGWLCETEADWVEALRQLIENPDLRQQLGETAQTEVRDRYLTRSALVDSWQAWQWVLTEPPLCGEARKLTLGIVVWCDSALAEDLHRWSSWDYGIAALAKLLGDSGHEVTVYLQGDPALSNHDFLERKRVWDDRLAGSVAEVDYFEHRRQRPVVCDVAIATHWQTAYAVADLERVRLRVQWMMADPTSSSPLGDRQGEAKNASVFLPLRPIAVGEELRHTLVQTPGFRNVVDAVPLPLAPEFTETEPQPERHLLPDGSVNVLWFDDPNTDPAVRFQVLATLAQLQREYDEKLLVQCYGRPAPAGFEAEHGLRHLGKVADNSTRSQLFSLSNIHGAIAPSSVQVTVEAIACGCVGVVLGEDPLDDLGDFVVESPLDPDSFASHLRQLIDDAQRRSALAEKGAAWARELTWEKTVEATLEIINQITFLGADLLGADSGTSNTIPSSKDSDNSEEERLEKGEDCD